MSLNQGKDSHAIYFQQDHFLDQLIQGQHHVYLYLQNGVKLKGYILGFDNHVIFLADVPRITDATQMVYKSSISTVLKVTSAPAKASL